MGGRTLKALIPIRKRKSCWIFYTAIDMKTDLIFFIAIFVIAVLFIGHFRLTFSGAPDKPCGVGRADANPKLLLNDT